MKKVYALAVSLMMAMTASATLTLQGQGGWYESCWMEFTGLSSDYATYNGYVKAANAAEWTALDGELIRSYGSYGRVDALGLQAGNYQLKVVPVKDNVEVEADQVVSDGNIEVKAFDRSGFAHFGWTKGVGAYNDNGTLKTGTQVLYVTNSTAKTVSMEVTSDSKNGKTKFTGLQAIVTAYQKGLETRPLCVRFIGKVTADGMDGFDSSSEGLQIKGKTADAELNMTFEGVGNDAFIYGFGFLVRNAKSVEMRNFGVATLIDDDISLDTDNKHIWIHNIDAFYGPNKGGDQKKGDGAIDIKSDSKNVTVSYCHFWDTGKSTMCGMKSESGPNYITYHHNWFDHSDSRHARIRTMSVHMYNNYYDGIAKYGAGACTGSSVFMDRNFFHNCPRPMMISMQGTDTKNGTDLVNAPTFSKEDGGMIKAFGNAYDGTSVEPRDYSVDHTEFDCYKVTDINTQVPSSVKSKKGGNTYDNFDTSSGKMYENYAVDNVTDVPAIVSNRTWGAGRMQGGDFLFEFTDADNELYEVNANLRSAIENYTSHFVKIIGKETTDDGSTPEPVDPGDTRDESTFNITSQTSITIEQGGISKIDFENAAGAVTYVSNNEAIATVAADGSITAVSAGKTMITVTDAGSDAVKGKSLTVSVIVIGTVIDNGNVTIQAGELPYGYEYDESTSATLFNYASSSTSYNWTTDNLFKAGKAQHEIKIPAGVKVTEVVFYGVTDDNSNKALLTELAGKTYTSGIALANRKSETSPVTKTETGLAIENLLTFTITGKNAAVKLSLKVESTTTAIQTVSAKTATAVKAGKYVKNGKLVILRDGKEFSVTGVEIR